MFEGDTKQDFETVPFHGKRINDFEERELEQQILLFGGLIVVRGRPVWRPGDVWDATDIWKH